MSSVAHYSSKSDSQLVLLFQGSRAVAALIRLPMIALTVVLILIAFRYLVHPVRTAAAAGIVFTSPGGLAVARVGFGAFPLGFVAFFLSCLFSPGRILLGLRTELTLLAIVIAVRIGAMEATHSTVTAKLLLPEVVMAALCMLAIRLERGRGRLQPLESTVHQHHHK
jgi:hypothetical protein